MIEDEEEMSDTENVTKSFGVMKVDGTDSKTFYLGETHWAAILNDIAEVRNYWKTHKREYDDQVAKVSAVTRNDPHDNGPALLFSSAKPPPRHEIISALPSRYLTDILIARYFNSFDPATHILHGPTFHKQYAQHWEDPSKTSIVWIGMLFAMLRLSMLSYHRQGDEPPEFRGKSLDLSVSYRTQMAHCLILADYTKPHAHLIEALIFHLHGEYSRSNDMDSSIWVLVGMIARMAMRMGYHRDSRWYPDISPFQGEMRRRIWTFVRQADLLFSFQTSMPPMIRTGDSDTDLPRNIFDDEFGEDSKELPPPRSPSESTPVSYMIAKSRLAFGFGRVMEHMNSVHAGSYEEVLKIDAGLREIFESLPEHFHLRPMQDMQLDPLLLIMARFGVASIYHKAQLVLHRRFLQLSRLNPRYVQSRRQCLESGMKLLGYQRILHQESKPKGRMQSHKWYQQSMTMNDFLLAATIICMDLYYGMQAPESASGTAYTWGIPSQEDLVEALAQARDIWAELRDETMMAYKASELLTMMLQKLQRGSGQSVVASGLSPATNFQMDTGDEKQNAAMTLGLLSSGAMTPNSAAAAAGQSASQQARPFTADNVSGSGVDQSGPFNAPSPFSMNMFGNPMDISGGSTGMNLDWESWDNYMSAFNQQPVAFNFDPANNLWGTPPAVNSAPSPPGGSGNPFSPYAFIPSSTHTGTTGTTGLSPASPGSLGSILNPGLLYPTTTNGSTSGSGNSMNTPASSSTTGASGASPPNQQSPQPRAAENQTLPNPSGPFMGNPESNMFGSNQLRPRPLFGLMGGWKADFSDGGSQQQER